MKAEQDQLVEFRSIRQDWLNANSYVPRLIKKSVVSDVSYRFSGFPRQWIPVFEWYRVAWSNSIAPTNYIPWFSEFSEEEVVSICQGAKSKRSIRTLLEYATVVDPLIANLVHKLEHLNCLIRSGDSNAWNCDEDLSRSQLFLTTWQSYGRPAIQHLVSQVAEVRSSKDTAIILPCSSGRPYDTSRKHKKLYTKLAKAGVDTKCSHRIVISALGIIPEELWSDPAVISYNAGVPDIYRILCMAREYFVNQNYSIVYDCTDYAPYSDLLLILKMEKRIVGLRKLRGIVGRKEHHHYVTKP